MGSKLEAKGVAAAAGVPVLTPEEVDGYPPGKLEAAAEVLGWPVVAKASAGRSPLGLRVVREGDDLVAAVESVRREAVAAFGDGAVFLEPWLESARRVEVQIFGDATGRVVHLFERDCSLQRRHRTVVGEAPAPRLAPPLRERLHDAAVAVGEAVRHVGAGTVGFLVSGEQFWFLGMDTGLQPEHALTEALLGLDLVRMQLAAAEGRPLPVEARHCTPSGHAVEARLCAEEPAGGRLRRFEIDPGPGLRVETGVTSGSDVGPPDDRWLATVVAHATTRGEALRRLAAALEGARIHGLRTNRDALTAALRHPDVVTGGVDTGFFDRHDDALAAPRGGRAEAVRLHAAAAALAAPGARRTSFRGPAGERVEVITLAGPAGEVTVEVDGLPLPGLRVGPLTGGAVDLEVDGVRRLVRVARAGAVVDVDSILGHTELVELDA
jgi:propionyl-CoA carboxylase alpha chain